MINGEGHIHVSSVGTSLLPLHPSWKVVSSLSTTRTTCGPSVYMYSFRNLIRRGTQTRVCGPLEGARVVQPGAWFVGTRTLVVLVFVDPGTEYGIQEKD